MGFKTTLKILCEIYLVVIYRDYLFDKFKVCSTPEYTLILLISEWRSLILADSNKKYSEFLNGIFLKINESQSDILLTISVIF